MERRKGYQIRLLIPVRLPRTRYVPDTSFKPSIEIGSEVLDPILRRVHLSPEFGLPAVALLSLLLVDAILSAQSLFLETLVRILRGKVVDCHPSGFAFLILGLNYSIIVIDQSRFCLMSDVFVFVFSFGHDIDSVRHLLDKLSPRSWSLSMGEIKQIEGFCRQG